MYLFRLLGAEVLSTVRHWLPLCPSTPKQVIRGLESFNGRELTINKNRLRIAHGGTKYNPPVGLEGFRAWSADWHLLNSLYVTTCTPRSVSSPMAIANDSFLYLVFDPPRC